MRVDKIWKQHNKKCTINVKVGIKHATRTFTLCPSALEVCNFLLLFYRGLQLEVVLES